MFAKYKEEESFCLQPKLSEAFVCETILGFRNMFCKVIHFPSLFLLDEESCLQDNKTFEIQGRKCIIFCLVIPGRKLIPLGTQHILFSP